MCRSLSMSMWTCKSGHINWTLSDRGRGRHTVWRHLLLFASGVVVNLSALLRVHPTCLHVSTHETSSYCNEHQLSYATRIKEESNSAWVHTCAHMSLGFTCVRFVIYPWKMAINFGSCHTINKLEWFLNGFLVNCDKLHTERWQRSPPSQNWIKIQFLCKISIKLSANAGL